jgi:predicted NACHT family NTPase
MLPSNFLREIAENYGLTEKEQEVFLEKFGSNNSEQAITNQLHLSGSAIRNRLSGVYRKFSISGSGPVKSDHLFRFLTKEYQKSHPTPIDETLKSDKDIDALVQEIRKKVKPLIQERCGKMRVLDMEQAIEIADIYTNVNILERITGRRRLKLSDLLQAFDPEKEEFDRCGLGQTQERVPGLDAVNRYPKLMVLGKPGAGKTTFLKNVAIQCICGEFQSNRVPLFITLKQFAEISEKPNLLEFINHEFAKESITDAPILELINQGRALILLDGLDEVREEDSNRVLEEIKKFSTDYYTNQFLITCRIAAREYTLEQFVEVEVADFNDKQIEMFASKWFSKKELDVAKRFVQELESNQPIKELAANPLLLTLLCLEFEDSGDFPSDRAELYNRAIYTLLRKWDSKRGIKRDEVYKKLSVRYKEDLLSDVAWTTFERKDYFFKQRDIERYISDYIQNLPEAKTDPEALRVDSEGVLKSIEAQHGLLVERARGIYSFSHLTFQEYFTANKIVDTSGLQSLEQLKILANHITEKRWHEVFLLATGMLADASDLLLLMKEKIDELVVSDEKIQQFLSWANQKSLSVNSSYKPATARAFYNSQHAIALALTLASDLNDTFAALRDILHDISRKFNVTSLDLNRDFNIDLDLDRDSNIDLALDPVLELTLGFASLLDVDFNHALVLILDLVLNLESELQHSLQELKAQLPALENDHEIKLQWWKVNGQNWTKQLRSLMRKHRKIRHNWQFNQQQQKLLKQYYYANKLLVDCLNNGCYLKSEVRQKIENTLLLPSHIL